MIFDFKIKFDEMKFDFKIKLGTKVFYAVSST